MSCKSDAEANIGDDIRDGNHQVHAPQLSPKGMGFE